MIEHKILKLKGTVVLRSDGGKGKEEREKTGATINSS